MLDTLLFFICINDICSILQKPKKICIYYADNLQLYVQFSYEELNNYIEFLSLKANEIFGWISQNHLCINSIKMKFIFLVSFFLLNKFTAKNHNHIDIYNYTVSFKSSVKSLGVIFDFKII